MFDDGGPPACRDARVRLGPAELRPAGVLRPGRELEPADLFTVVPAAGLQVGEGCFAAPEHLSVRAEEHRKALVWIDAPAYWETKAWVWFLPAAVLHLCGDIFLL